MLWIQMLFTVSSLHHGPLITDCRQNHCEEIWKGHVWQDLTRVWIYNLQTTLATVVWQCDWRKDLLLSDFRPQIVAAPLFATCCIDGEISIGFWSHCQDCCSVHGDRVKQCAELCCFCCSNAQQVLSADLFKASIRLSWFHVSGWKDFVHICGVITKKIEGYKRTKKKALRTQHAFCWSKSSGESSTRFHVFEKNEVVFWPNKAPCLPDGMQSWSIKIDSAYCA